MVMPKSEDNVGIYILHIREIILYILENVNKNTNLFCSLYIH